MINLKQSLIEKTLFLDGNLVLTKADKTVVSNDADLKEEKILYVFGTIKHALKFEFKAEFNFPIILNQIAKIK